MGIEDLIGKTQRGPGRNFADSIPREICKKIRSDFRDVVEAKKAGKCVPGTAGMVQHVKDEYNITMGWAVAKRWMEHAREELNVKNK